MSRKIEVFGYTLSLGKKEKKLTVDSILKDLERRKKESEAFELDQQILSKEEAQQKEKEQRARERRATQTFKNSPEYHQISDIVNSRDFRKALEKIYQIFKQRSQTKKTEYEKQNIWQYIEGLQRSHNLFPEVPSSVNGRSDWNADSYEIFQFNDVFPIPRVSSQESPIVIKLPVDPAVTYQDIREVFDNALASGWSFEFKDECARSFMGIMAVVGQFENIVIGRYGYREHHTETINISIRKNTNDRLEYICSWQKHLKLKKRSAEDAPLLEEGWKICFDGVIDQKSETFLTLADLQVRMAQIIQNKNIAYLFSSQTLDS